MNLHNYPKIFDSLVPLVAKDVGIPEDAIRRDYYLVMMLQKLEESSFADSCVFKGGTSLSKCFPDSICRFSEDIDLTYLGGDGLALKQCDKRLKQIETTMSAGFTLKKIPEERNNRNKSSYVYFDERHPTLKIKLEIGSLIRPDPYNKREIKTYIGEYLEKTKHYSDVKKYDLKPVTLNVVEIERTFLDKVMAVKRHAICQSLVRKVRHIYDVTKLFPRKDIQDFLSSKVELKSLVDKTKKTDRFYLEKRKCNEKYNPEEPYHFSSWEKSFEDHEVKKAYLSLASSGLLYSNKALDFSEAVETFQKINAIFENIGE